MAVCAPFPEAFVIHKPNRLRVWGTKKIVAKKAENPSIVTMLEDKLQLGAYQSQKTIAKSNLLLRQMNKIDQA